MNDIVDLLSWKRSRLQPAPRAQVAPEVRSNHHADAVSDAAAFDTRRLESAVRHLDVLTSRAIRRDGRLSAQIETELLAILGELSMGLLEAACQRSERLVARLRGAARQAGLQG